MRDDIKAKTRDANYDPFAPMFNPPAFREGSNQLKIKVGSGKIESITMTPKFAGKRVNDLELPSNQDA